MGGWLAPERLQHINAGALTIYANGIGMLKIYFLEYRKSTIDSPRGKSHPSIAPLKTRVFSKVRGIKSYLKNCVKLIEEKMDEMICTITFVTHALHS